MKKLLTYCLVLLSLASCIVNDLPYPVMVATVNAIIVDGAESVTVDQERRSIVADMPEEADLSQVRVKSIRFGIDGTVSEPDIVATHDLRTPKKFTFRTYQDYSWTLSAEQTVERYFTVSGQVGSSVVDDANMRAVAYVSKSVSLDAVTVTSLKLGPREISSYSPEMDMIHDFSDGGVAVELAYRDQVEVWTLYVEQTESVVDVDKVEPWTRCAWASANGVAGQEHGFRFRQKGSDAWQTVSDVKEDGGAFLACLDGLMPLTTYEYTAFSGENETPVYEFTTEEERQLPNAGFETFSKAESSSYFSWFDPAATSPWLQSKWWDSGNIGSTTAGSSYTIAIPDTENRMEGNASAMLVSRNVIIKFAAGNTFSGEFVGTIGTTGGIINFGRPFEQRPRALKLWMKYECGAVDCVDSYPADEPVKMGDPDNGQIWAALGDWEYKKYGGTPDSPVQVNTTDKSTFFKPEGDSVIAYASYVADATTDGWVELEIPFDYSTYFRKPTHIIVSFASSRLGDYFTGSSKSRLWIDDVRLIY